VLNGQARGRDELTLRDGYPQPLETGEDVAPGPRRGVGGEAQPQPAVAQQSHRLDRTGDRLVLDIEHAVEVEQHRGRAKQPIRCRRVHGVSLRGCRSTDGSGDLVPHGQPATTLTRLTGTTVSTADHIQETV
jgi:hypothetical protein